MNSQLTWYTQGRYRSKLSEQIAAPAQPTAEYIFHIDPLATEKKSPSIAPFRPNPIVIPD